MRHYQRIIVLLLLALTAGCATLNESECRTVDWRELGRSDGAKGYESSRLGDHMEACGKFGIAPDAEAYRAGREEGLRQYCTLDNAMQLGMNGSGFNQVCPGEISVAFAQTYNRGAALHAIRSDMQDVQDRLNSEHATQEKVKDLELYKQFDQNIHYLEREIHFIQQQYDRAAQAVSSGFDPPYFEAGEWRSGIPYPKAQKEAEKKN
jgi:hypothetical protein